MHSERKPWRSFLVFLFLGLLAVLSLYPMYVELLPQQLAELNIPLMMSVEVLALLSLINPFILISLGVLVGHLVATRSGFTSFIYEKDRLGKPLLPRLQAILLPSILLGVISGVIIMVVEYFIQPLLPSALQMTDSEATITFYDFASRILYGGIAEEIMLRWGVMSLLVFMMWKVFQRKLTQPTQIIIWIGIILSALLFGLGHYGATAAVTEMTPVVFARMLFLNGFAGIIYGWLYWKKGLEAAMIAHMFTHVTFIVIITFLFL
ncbi:CPBP family intramembrane glutamic endopeptidase [Alkalicoccobacillus porphyridii]|uniref:CPBP family intramembrane metalloprotease n=1 Tax=Alkalicoccobacillus porphyridii TaxID=2597270 RepID=A0A553ZW96_9BACI|nr:CPBP family intramembrane glutamic endopeptidase [Alkalicoccobacillus porphyridii]TSB45741.1 CPBP family intramembrane metalloprotease [Alkalicoccobacillus porphyridii]